MEDKKKGKEEKKAGFNLEDLGIGGIFSGIGKLIELAGDLKEVEKEGEIDLSDIKKGMKGVYGFSVKTAVGGKPKFETFGNIKTTPKGPEVAEEREPLIDVFDEKDELVIIAEMPGIEENDLKIDLREDILEISAVSKNRTYRKELLLPVKAVSQNLTHKFKNGILEIRIKK